MKGLYQRMMRWVGAGFAGLGLVAGLGGGCVSGTTDSCRVAQYRPNLERTPWTWGERTTVVAPANVPKVETVPAKPVAPPVAAPKVETVPAKPVMPPAAPKVATVPAKPVTPLSAPKVETVPAKPVAPPVAAPKVGAVPVAPAAADNTATGLLSDVEAVEVRVDSERRKLLKRGNKLHIQLRGIPRPEDITDEVDSFGEVNLPYIGKVRIEGLTTSGAEERIEKRYVDGGIYQRITVIVVAEEDQYYIRGEVRAPGRYPLSGDVTLLQAIATAGGYTDFARMTKIMIIRGDKMTEYDARDIERLKVPDPFIKANDNIVVPRSWH